MIHWIHHLVRDAIYWLSGVPGSGKSCRKIKKRRIKLMKKFLVVLLVLMASLMSSSVRADYPLGFDKIHEICNKHGEIVSEDLKTWQTSLFDTDLNNIGGRLVLGCGESSKGIGVHIVKMDKAGEGIVGLAIFHLHNRGNLLLNLFTNETDIVSDEMVARFINKWLELYSQAIEKKA